MRYTIGTSIILAACVAALAGCGNTTSVNNDIDSRIDSASQQLKDSIRRVDVDKHISDAQQHATRAGQRVANDPDFRSLGLMLKDGLDKADQALDRWLNHPQSETR